MRLRCGDLYRPILRKMPPRAADSAGDSVQAIENAAVFSMDATVTHPLAM